MLSFIEKILFPPRCVSCGAEGDSVCASCRIALTPRVEHPNIGVPCTSIYAYDNPVVRKVILAWKYRGNAKAGSILLGGFSACVAHCTLPPDALLVPVPTRRARNNRRGFAPPEVLAGAAARVLHMQVCAPLTYARKTHQQAGLPLAKRLKNMHNAFVVSQENVMRGRTVILVDDIVTTGATLRAAADALHDNGTTDIRAITLAWNP